MNTRTLTKDPLNLIISGVGGQGNVVISLMIGNALVNKGYFVMIGQTFVGLQRGGQVRNYLRISKEKLYSPIIPHGCADIIISMELVEAVRELAEFGNSNILTVVNPRIVAPPGLKSVYPEPNKVLEDIKELSGRTLVVNATEEAAKMGNPILANVILVGALVGTGMLPLNKESVESELCDRFPKAVDINLKAFNRGVELTAGS